MPEPLSIAAGMAGALTAAAKISSTLKAVKKNAKDAPRQVAVLLEEARGTAEVLSSLQSLLLGKERLDPSRTKLLRVESVIAIVTGCVSTFSQLQEVVDYLRHDDPGVIDRARWVAREATIGAIIVRLQTHKSSLFLIVVGVINGYLPRLSLSPSLCLEKANHTNQHPKANHTRSRTLSRPPQRRHQAPIPTDPRPPPGLRLAATVRCADDVAIPGSPKLKPMEIERRGCRAGDFGVQAGDHEGRGLYASAVSA